MGWLEEFTASIGLAGFRPPVSLTAFMAALMEHQRLRAGNYLAGLASRKDEVKRRCRTVPQSRAVLLLRDSWPDSRRTASAHPILALV